MSNLVIVAIPAENDRVWKISSEKVPHLTLLFLGDADNSKLEQIMLFVEHAVNLCEHGPFYLDVDRRDTLGPDDADVLMFNKRSWNLKWIKQFRGQLLQNQDIKTAYDSTEQYDEWAPHLTLGYPATPAKPLPNDGFDHPIYSVEFDRIAVWTGDFEGPEFRLEWPERDNNYDLAVAYGEVGKSAVEELLHVGVKGMKWGVRNTNRQFAKSGKLMSDAKKLEERSVGKGAVKSRVLQSRATSKRHKSVKLSNAVDVKVMNQTQKSAKKELAGLRKKPEFKNINYRDAKGHPQFDSDKFRALEKAESQIWVKHLNKTVSGYKFDVEVKSGTWELTPSKIEHADNARVVVRPIRDADGYLVDMELVEITEDAMAQTTELGQEFVLSHASVLDDPSLRDQIKAKVQSILDDVTGDADKDLNLFGDPLIRTKLQSVLDDFYKLGAEKAMAYSAIAEACVEHIGIKGMKWGVRRREAPTAVAPTATSKIPHGSKRKTKIETDGGENHPAHEDAIKVAKAQAKLKKSGSAALSNQELRDVATRVQLENQVSLLTGHKGKQFVAKQLEGEGKNLARAGVRTGVKTGAKKAGFTTLAGVI